MTQSSENSVSELSNGGTWFIRHLAGRGPYSRASGAYALYQLWHTSYSRRKSLALSFLSQQIWQLKLKQK